ncbi:probable gluconokinase isoform X2 [Eurytemora carolleeae]|nr:probable gluconokinase isoform X2 [Eurytemora carolleeae]|eukprot:XP_023323848.1 probable gluconokinase isoform X2 [Eurytemora affinis]
MVNIVLMGVSGSGKTRVGGELVQQLDFTFKDGDDFHSLENRAKMKSGIPLTDEDREPWLKTLASLLRDNDKLILACSALKHAYREKLRGDSRQIIFVHLVVPADILLNRLQSRTQHYFPPQLLDNQLQTLESASDGEKIFNIDNSQPLETVICQIKQIIDQAEN